MDLVLFRDYRNFYLRRDRLMLMRRRKLRKEQLFHGPARPYTLKSRAFFLSVFGAFNRHSYIVRRFLSRYKISYLKQEFTYRARLARLYRLGAVKKLKRLRRKRDKICQINKLKKIRVIVRKHGFKL